MKFALNEDGVTAAMATAGRAGYAIPKDHMVNILAAAMPHIQEVDDGNVPVMPNAHSKDFEAAVEHHINLLWASYTKHEKLLNRGFKGRVRWLFHGVT